MKALFKAKGTGEARGLCEGVLIPTISYGCETWVCHAYEKSRVRSVEMNTEMQSKELTG